jgi:hypothetical protein
MHRGSVPWLAILIEVLATAGAGVLGFIVASVLLFAVYVVSIRHHPRVRHMTGLRHCNGSGEIRSTLFPWVFHKCPGCSGGRQIRLGARYLGQPHIKAEHAKVMASRKRAKDGHAWR